MMSDAKVPSIVSSDSSTSVVSVVADPGTSHLAHYHERLAQYDGRPEGDEVSPVIPLELYKLSLSFDDPMSTETNTQPQPETKVNQTPPRSTSAELSREALFEPTPPRRIARASTPDAPRRKRQVVRSEWMVGRKLEFGCSPGLLAAATR